MCPGTASATGVCFIGFWTAPTQKKWHTKPIKADKSWEGCSKSHFGWKREKHENWCTEARVGQFLESFWRPGDTQISKKQLLLTLFFSVVFRGRKRGGGAEQGMVWTGVWSLKRSYSLIEEVILWVLFSVFCRIEVILKWSLWEEVSEMKSLKKSSLKHALVLKHGGGYIQCKLCWSDPSYVWVGRVK